MCYDKYLKTKQIETNFLDNELSTNKRFCMAHTKTQIDSIFENYKNCYLPTIFKDSECKFKEKTKKDS